VKIKVMFVLFISIVCLIISILVVTVLYNIIDRFVYSVTRKKVSSYVTIQCILIGILLTILCFLEYDLVTGLLHFLP